MHGIIHAELKKYVETNHGPEAWRAILDKAGLGNKIYMAISTYEDAVGSRFALAPMSTWTVGTSIPFSARKMRTRRGFGAKLESWSFTGGPPGSQEEKASAVEQSSDPSSPSSG